MKKSSGDHCRTASWPSSKRFFGNRWQPNASTGAAKFQVEAVGGPVERRQCSCWLESWSHGEQPAVSISVRKCSPELTHLNLHFCPSLWTDPFWIWTLHLLVWIYSSQINSFVPPEPLSERRCPKELIAAAAHNPNSYEVKTKGLEMRTWLCGSVVAISVIFTGLLESAVSVRFVSIGRCELQKSSTSSQLVTHWPVAISVASTFCTYEYF